MDMTQGNTPARNAAPVAPLVPPVDIFEDADGITLKADLPGVAKDGLAIGVEGETLTIEGSVDLDAPATMTDVYAEIGVARYKRTFELARDLDTDRIDANLKNGVLTLRIPKREQAKPRRIAVQVA